MDHVRIDPKFRRRPRPKRAGWAAREVFKFLLEVSAEFDLRGRFPPSMQEVDWLAEEWANGDTLAMPGCAVLLTESLGRLREVGLTHLDGADLVISDWEEFYKPAKSDAERASDYRSRHAPSRSSRSVTDAVTPSRHVTEPVTRHASHERHATTQHSTALNYTKEEAPPADAMRLVGRPTEQPEDLQGALLHTFRNVRGHDYRWQSADDMATRQLPVTDVPEVTRRYAIGLRRSRFPICNGVADLAKHWNAYASAESAQTSGDKARL